MGREVEDAGTQLQAGTIPPSPPLLPVPDSIVLPGDRLCSACSALNLTPHRFIVWPDEQEYGQLNSNQPKPILRVLVAVVRKNTYCPLCRLLLVAIGGNGRVPDVDARGRPLHVMMTWINDGRIASNDHPWFKLSDIRTICPELVLESGQLADVDIESLNVIPQIALLANDAPLNTPGDALPFLPRLVCREAIDFGLVRRWLAICDARHGRICSSDRIMREMGWDSPWAAVPAFRCVDLEQERLVRLHDAPGDAPYAALSYVWGRAASDEEFFKTLRANVSERELPGFFAREESQRRLPATIRDAMTVARRIGLRYLWVDSLCIVQDGHGKDWLDAIRKMDMVYGAAYVVICAAGSSSAFAGIPGVSLGRGPAYALRDVEQIGEDFRLVHRSTGSFKLRDEHLPYHRRGWTFQEYHFASRPLVFAGGGISLTCRSQVEFLEDTVEDTSWVDEQRGSAMIGGKNDIGGIESLIQSYSARELTVDTDIYRAFAGVARQIGKDLKCDLCQGLPTRFFDWFLLWQPQGSDDSTPQRRPVAPSWSWAGWRSTSWSHIWDWYTRSMEVVQQGIRKRTWIIWYERTKHTSACCIAVRRRGKDEEGKGLNMYGGEARKEERFGGIDCSTTEPTARTLVADGLPSYTEDICREEPGSGFLQFWTVSAVFELRLVGTGDNGAYGQRASKSQSESPSSTSAGDGEWPEVGSEETYASELGDASVPLQDDIPPSSGSEGNDNDVEYDSDKQPGVKLIIGGKSGRAIGRIYVPSWWGGLAEIQSTDKPCRYEFVLLCEARDQHAEDVDGGWRYRVMLLEPKLEGLYYERVSIGSIGVDDIVEAVSGLTWKEIILG